MIVTSRCRRLLSRRGESQQGGRGVSPVVGVVLMLAVTITLVAVVVPVAFAISGDTTSGEPSVDFAFSYEGSAEPTIDDTFGNTSDDVNATGLVTIVLNNGDPVPADKLEIAGAASGGLLSDSDEYSDSDEIVPGETITVWANRGSDLSILWFGDGESATLARFPLRPGGDLPVFVPEPDEDCGWVEDQLTGTNDLTIDGIIVDCDLSAYSINDLDVVNDGGVIGDVPINGSLDLDDGTVYIGDVETNGDLTMDNGAEIDGDVVVNDASSSAFTVDDASIQGSVDVAGDATVTGTTIRRGIDANGDLDLSNAAVDASANATGTITMTSGSTVGSDASSDTEISLDDQSEIGGDAVLPDVGTDLICSDDDNSLVDGVGCLEYTEPSYTVTIDDTNEPLEGDQLTMNVTVENTGYDDGTPEVSLYIESDQKANPTPSVDGESAKRETLNWGTSDGDAGTYDAVVEVDDADGNLHDSVTREILVANDSRTQTGLRFDIDGDASSTTIKVGDTVGYTATADFDDSSTKDVTDEVNISVTSGDPSNITIDEPSNEITGVDGDMLTLEANDTNGADWFTNDTDLTVDLRMANRTNVTSWTLGGSTVTFDVENTGTDPVKIESISVETAETNGSPDTVEIDNDSGNETVGGGGYLNTQSIEVGGGTYSFDVIPELAGGTTAEFDLGEFEEPKNNNDKALKPDTVSFTLYFSDGTKKQFTIN